MLSNANITANAAKKTSTAMTPVPLPVRFISLGSLGLSLLSADLLDPEPQTQHDKDQ